MHLVVSFALSLLPTSRFGSLQNGQGSSTLIARRGHIHMCASATTKANVHVGNVAGRLGKLVEDISSNAIDERGRFSVAISGGSLPKQLAAGLKSSPEIDFGKWDAFLADERVVPSDHPDSNRREILQHFPNLAMTPIDHTLPVREVAGHYQGVVCSILGDSPVFDAILLGLGPDGHTCSLFPEHPLVRCPPFTHYILLIDRMYTHTKQSDLSQLTTNLTWPCLQLNETKRIIADITDSPKPPPNRVTLTFPVINAARHVIFVCTGAAKASAVKDILEVSFLSSCKTVLFCLVTTLVNYETDILSCVTVLIYRTLILSFLAHSSAHRLDSSLGC